MSSKTVFRRSTAAVDKCISIRRNYSLPLLRNVVLEKEIQNYCKLIMHEMVLTMYYLSVLIFVYFSFILRCKRLIFFFFKLPLAKVSK